VRDTEWKLHVNIKEDKPTALYNLEKDIGESTDLLNEHPKMAAELLEVCKNFSKELKAKSRDWGWLSIEETKVLTK